MAPRKKVAEQADLGTSLNQIIDARVRLLLARLFEEISSLLRGTEPSTTRRPGRPARAAGGEKCSESGCTDTARSKGLCSKHYQKARRAGLKKPPAPAKKRPAKKDKKKDTAAAPAAA